MRPIRTEESNFTYLGFKPDIGDLPCRREDGVVYAVYAPTDEEREMIANGAQIQLGVHTEPIPPVSLNLVNEREVGGQGDGSMDYRCEGCRGLFVEQRAIELGYQCGFCQAQLELVTIDLG